MNGCGNGSGWCYVAETVHLKLLAQHFRTWSMGINSSSEEDPSDLETPPKALAASLRPAKAGVKNPLASNAEKPVSKELANAVPIQHPFFASLPPYPTFYPYSTYPPYPQQPPLPPYLSPVHATAPPPVTATPHLRSSPILSDSEDSMEKLDEYFAWLARLNPGKSEGLTKCLQTFKKQDIVIGIIDKLNDELFDSWGVSLGIRILIKTHVNKWYHAKAKGRI